MKCHPQLDLLELQFPKLHFSRKLRGRLVAGTEVFEGSMLDDSLKSEEMLVAKLPDPPSEDPNEDDIKDKEIRRKLSKLKKFNKKWLDNENSAPVEEKVRVADNVLKEVEETGVPKVDTKRAEVMKAKAEIADDTINEETEHPNVKESIEINEVNIDVEKEEDKSESVKS